MNKTRKALIIGGVVGGVGGLLVAIHHHRVSHGRWFDDKDPCHGRAGLTVAAGAIVPIAVGVLPANEVAK